MKKIPYYIAMLFTVGSLPAIADTPTDWVTTISAGDNYAGSTGTITFNDWGYKGPTGVGANDFVVGSGFDSGNIGQIQTVVTKPADWKTQDPSHTVLTDALAKDQDGNFYPSETPLPNANMDGSVNFYQWAYTTPTSTFNNMQIDKAGNYHIAKEDMSFGYYDEFNYTTDNGANVEIVDTGIDFQPYAISDAQGWCGSVLTSDPNGLSEMAGQVTFDFAFDANIAGFIATQIVPGFVMRSYGDYVVDITKGPVNQHFEGSAVANNTNPETGQLDPNYQNQVSFLGAGVVPATVWVINAGTPDVEIVEEGTPGATLHTNVYAGYAFLLRADAERTLEFIAPDGHSEYVATVPVPAAIWLFGSGLIGLFGLSRRKTN